MTVSRQAVTRRSKGQRSRSHGYESRHRCTVTNGERALLRPCATAAGVGLHVVRLLRFLLSLSFSKKTVPNAYGVDTVPSCQLCRHTRCRNIRHPRGALSLSAIGINFALFRSTILTRQACSSPLYCSVLIWPSSNRHALQRTTRAKSDGVTHSNCT